MKKRIKDWIGYPAEAAGILVSGGSDANISALECAREALIEPMTDRVVLYAADQTHSSIARAARLLGFRPDQVRILPTDSSHRLRIDAFFFSSRRRHTRSTRDWSSDVCSSD